MNLSVILLASILAALPWQAPPGGGDGSWVEPMREVHGRFRGRAGTFAEFGDSITDTLAFWTPLLYERKNAPPELEAAFRRVKKRLQVECWRKWKGPEYGNQGGRTIRWAHEGIDGWLRKLNPEVAVVLFGTNDLNSLGAQEYRKKLRDVVERCLANGTVVILSTLPPRSGFEKKAAEFSEVVRAVARETRVPLTDFHAEILRRRPDDWDGSLKKFEGWKGYDVPTLLARDGVHPSHPVKYRSDYSEEALRCCGYSLRNATVLLKYDEVIRAITAQAAKAPAPVSRPAWLPRPPPLPPAPGAAAAVRDAEGLLEAAREARAGTTIVVAAGRYALPRRLELAADRVTLRGATGDPRDVVLDGSAARLGEIVAISRARGVTIADLTIQNAKWNGFKINSETGVHDLVIRNCVVHNIWQRGVKGVKVPAKDRERLRPTGCRVEYCLFTNDHPKRFRDDPADTPENFNGNYIGGIDVMYARQWTVRDNVFVGIRGRTGEARGAVFLWHEAEDCVVERNVIIDCDTGICLGNSYKKKETPYHALRCTARNNFVTRAHETGILADYTRDCKIVHNTIHDPQSRLKRLIRVVHDNPGLVVADNLLSGPPPSIETASKITLRSNRQGDFTESFRDPASGDLRLRPQAAQRTRRGATIGDGAKAE